jgi:hypothetical protein
MKIGGTQQNAFIFACLALLILAGLACAQAGEVLTPEEATARAQGGVERESAEVEEGGIQVGDQATLTGRGFLINILDEPGGRLVANQERGVTVEVVGASEEEGELWYQIEAPTGAGWVLADNLVPLEGEADSGEGDEGGDEEGADESGLTIGGDAFLVGRGFLINILAEPAANARLIANQERGVRVTVVERITDDAGNVWYRIQAPTGDGWVAAENLSPEAP